MQDDPAEKPTLWMSVRQWYHLLQPARFCLLISLLVPVLFWLVPQGRDTLRGIASECADGVWWHAIFMLIGMLLAGLASWGWARLLLHCDFPTYDEVRNIPLNDLNKARLWLRRTCGLLPPVGMGVGFLVAAESGTGIWLYGVLALLSFGIATLLWHLFEHRVERLRSRFERTKLNASLGHLAKPLVLRLHTKSGQILQDASHNVRRFKYGCLADVVSDTFAFWAIVVTWAVSAITFVVFTCLPVKAGMLCGSPAVVLFAIMAWIGVSSVFIYLACRYRVPLLTLLLAWAVVCSCSNDNHAVRTLPRQADSSTNTSPGLVKALTNWYAEVSTKYPLTNSSQIRPLYLVASAGGGIRAAYWTTIVLGELEECASNNQTSFAAHTLVLSGVSGGSVGEVTFTALTVHRPSGETDCLANARKLLGNDFLAADLAKMAFADLLQRFLPWPLIFPSWDRARSLEDAWASAWVKEFHTNVLDDSIGKLYADAANTGVILPHLLLNGTCVETGQRIITSDLTIRSRVKAEGRENSNGTFLDVIPAADKLGNAPVRLSTAAHQSARFTYFSPAGRFPDGTHVVDGGYFENSGASTLMDALETVQWYITNHWTNVEPRIVLIDNDPVPLPQGTTNQFKAFYTDIKRRFLSETLSPVWALLNTRTARGSYAEEQALHYNWQATNIYQFNLYERPDNQPLGTNHITPVELPLGWTLSSRAMDEMDAQLTCQFERPVITVTNQVMMTNMISVTNMMVISNIVATLPRAAQ